MPDIFDQIHAQTTGNEGGDIFDQIHAQASAPPSGDIFDQIHASAQPSWQDRANAEIQKRGLNPLQNSGDMLAIADAYRKQFGTPQEQAIPDTGRQQQMLQQQEQQNANESRGVLSSNLIEALHPAGQLFARGERVLSAPVGTVSPGMASNMQASAQDLENVRGASGLTSLPGQLAGQLPMFANPLIAAASGGNEAYTADQQAQANGQQVGTLDEIGHVAGKAALDAIMSKVFQGKTPEASVIARAEQGVQGFVGKYLPQYLAKYGAKAAIGALANDASQVVGNALTQGTVNPNQSLTEGLGQSTLLGAGLPLAHEAATSFLGRLRAKQASAAEPTPELTSAPAAETTPQPTPAAEAKDLPKAAEFPAQENPPKQENVSPLEDRNAKWSAGDMMNYIKLKNSGELDEEATKQLLGDKQYQLKDVPIGDVGKVRGENGIVQDRVQEYANQRAGTAPPLVLGEDGRPIDGKHRLMAAQARGDQTVKAFVPVDEETAAQEQPSGAIKPSEGSTLNGIELKPEKAVSGPQDENAQEAAKRMSIYRSRQAGAVALPSRDDLVGPGSIYKEEVQPRLQQLADAGKEIINKTRSMFPLETGAGSQKAADIFRSHFAFAANDLHKAETTFQEARTGFDKLPQGDQWEFQRRMYDNTQQPTPELQKVADAMYDDTNAGRKALSALGNDAAAGWSDKWYNMMWKKDPAKAAELLSQINRPGKIEGKAGFLKARGLTDFAQGLAKGLVPKYDNPVDMFLATQGERNKYIAGVKGMEDLVKDGSITRADPKLGVPPGWSEVPGSAKGPLNGLIANGPFKDKLKGDGALIAPDPVNKILNNIVTPSAVGNSKVFRALMDANNTITQSLLGLSGFHVRKVTQELINLNVARALEAGTKGDIEGVKKSLLHAPVTPVEAIRNGSDIQRIMLGMKSASPEQAKVIDAMLQGGMRAKSDSVYETQWRRQFQKAWNQGGVQGMLRAVGYAPMAGNEAVMQNGVFDYVQHAKLHMGYEMGQDVLKRLGPSATPTDIRSEMGKVSDHLDNVLGMMVRDNLFWNRTARDLATLGTLSVGWNYGSGRALAGGVYDLGHGIGTLATGGKIADVDTRRIAYLASTAALTALTGAVTSYLATGKGPQALKDYVFPPTGNKDREGRDVRLNTGFYTSDWFDFMHHPVDTLVAKGSPLLHAAGALATNQEHGVQIRQSDDPWYKQAAQVAKYLGKISTPLSVNQLVDTIKGGGGESKSLPMKLLPFAGIRQAPKTVSESEAEQKAYDILGDKREIGGRTQAQVDRSRLIDQLAGDIRNKEPSAWKNARAAIRSGTLQASDVKEIEQRAKEPAGLAGLLKDTKLDAHDLMSVWGKMTPEERQKTYWTMRRRIVGASSLSAEDRQAFLHRVIEDRRGS